jgi:predicted DNA-binding protein
MFEDSHKHPEKVTANFTVADKKRLSILADQTGISEADIMRKLVLKGLNDLESKNPMQLYFEGLVG